MAAPSRPSNRDAFEIAILCALPVEFDAIDALFDINWEETQSYGKVYGDPNAYRTGRIGNNNVVVAYLPEMGTRSAATTATWLSISFRNIKLGLVVGICGGVPYTAEGEEIVLGDIIISTGIVMYDYWRRFPNEVRRKDTLESNLPKPTAELRSFLRILGSKKSKKSIQNKTYAFLGEICRQEGLETSLYPGMEEDRLYEGNYRHKHQNMEDCLVCAACETDTDPVCELALNSSCAVLGCSKQRTLKRKRLHNFLQLEAGSSHPRPLVHFGRIASGDIIMKSGSHRDQIAQNGNVIAFEMEGAGVWEAFPSVVIKAVSDYADSHKNKLWQQYAAAGAAACSKAFLQEWRSADKPLEFPANNIKIELQHTPSVLETLNVSRVGNPLSHPGVQQETKQDQDGIYVDELLRESDALTILSKHGVDFEALGANGALLWTAKQGYDSIIDFALNRGATLAVKDEEAGRTALHIACRYGHHTMTTKLIRRGLDMSLTDKFGECALHIAARQGQIDCVKALVFGGACTEVVNKAGMTPLLEAAWCEHCEIVSLLLQRSADIRASPGSSQDNGFIHRNKAKYARDMSLHIAVATGNLSMVKLLIDTGLRVNTRNVVYEETPLFTAATRNLVHIMKYLIERGADVNARNAVGSGIADVLLSSESRKCGDVEALRILIDSDVDVNAQSELGTALHTAAWNLDVSAVEMLLASGAQKDIKRPHDDSTPIEVAKERALQECSWNQYSWIAELLGDQGR